MKRDTKKIGTVSELMVMAALVRAGYRILIPYGDSARYDVVVEDADGAFHRVQIKTGCLRNGAIEFKGFSTHSHRGRASIRNYVGEVEFFGIYSPQVGRCYLIPASQVPWQGSLRIDPTKNRQSKGIRWAADYALPLTDEKAVGASTPLVVPFPSILPS